MTLGPGPKLSPNSTMGIYKFDIVIVSYKSKAYLLACLESILRSLDGEKGRIFVEDNNSGEDLTGVRKRFPQIELNLNTQNLGFARAANKGISRGNAPYILLINPDSLVRPGFFEQAISFMEENPSVGILGPRIMNVDDTIQGSARSFPTPLTAWFGRSSLLSRLFPENRITRKNVLSMLSDGTTPMKVDWVSGACMVIRRKALEDVGLFDEQFFMYWEDADICRRMRERGWEVVYFPRAQIVHYSGVSSSQRVFRSLLEFHKSSYRLFCKYWTRELSVVKPLAITALAARLGVVLPSTLIRCKLQRALQESGDKGGKIPRLRIQESNRIRVLRVISRLNIGGPAIHVTLLTTGLNSKRFQNYLVTGRPSAREGDMSYLFGQQRGGIIQIPTLHREINLLTDFKTVISLYRLMHQVRPQIVDTHTAKAGFTGRIAAWLFQLIARQEVAVVHTFHGNVFRGYFGKSKSQFYIWIERALSRLTDVVIAISPTQRDELVKTYRIGPPEKVKVVRLGLDLRQFIHCERMKGKYRQDLSIGSRVFLVGIIGRLVPIKNHVMFMKAASIFVKEHPGTEVLFAVVGDGELREYLENMAQDMGLDEKIRFCGWVKDISRVYADLNALVLTSINEGTPVSIIEAMASRVPVISTCVGGVQDLVGNPSQGPAEGGFAMCSRGILCNSNDALGLARALEYLYEEPDEEKEKRVMRALAFVREKYSNERLVSEMESLYLHLLEKKCPGALREAAPNSPGMPHLLHKPFRDF